MRETKLYDRLRPKFTAWGEISRVENIVEQGMWDIYYTCNGQMNWVETKIVHADKLYFEKFQIPWGRRHYKAGANNLFVIAGIDDHRQTMQVFHVKEIIQAPTETYRKWTTININNINAIFELRKPYDWDDLRQLLSRPFT